MNPEMMVRSQHRASYEYIMALAQKELGPNNSVLAYPGYLRSEVALSTGQSCDFAILANQQIDGQTIGGTEQRLQQNDAFFITRMAVMLYAADQEGTTGQASQINRAQARLQQFPNTAAFAQNTSAVTGFFNGRLTIKQNEKIFCRDTDLWSMQYADTAQEGQLVFTASNVASNAIDYERSFRQALDPMFRLNGQSNIEANIQFPAGLDFTQESERVVYAVLYLKGWRAQNFGIARS